MSSVPPPSATEPTEPLRIETVALPEGLFDDPEKTAQAVGEVLNRHLRSARPNAREAARDLFQGHGFADWEVLRLRPGAARLPAFLQDLVSMPRHEITVQTLAQARQRVDALDAGPLRAACLALLLALEEGAPKEVLDKRQEMVFFERMRALARRIVDYEFSKAHAERQARGWMADPDPRVSFVQVRLASGRPAAEVCVFSAQVDRYGLGPGVYPKASALRPPHGWNCGCTLEPRADLAGRAWPRLNPRAELEYLRQMTPAAQLRLLGTQAAVRRALAGDPVVDLINRSRDPLRALVPLGSYSAPNEH